MQNKYSRPASRRIALEEEEQNAIEIYVKNLREDIERLVIPSNLKTFLEAQQKANDMELWIHDANITRARRIATQRKPIINEPRPVTQDKTRNIQMSNVNRRLDNISPYQRTYNLEMYKVRKDQTYTRTLLFQSTKFS